jgi:hypothetical protein
VGLLERALAVVGDGDSAARARLLAQLGVEQSFSDERGHRVHLAEEALAMARRLGDRATLADVLLDRYYTVFSPDNLAQRVSDSAELLALAEERGDMLLSFRVAWIVYRSAIEAGQIDLAGRCVVEAERLAGELCQPLLVWLAAILRSGWSFLRDGPDEALAHILSTFELGRVVSPADGHLFWLIQQGLVLAELGRLGELADRLRTVPEMRGNRFYVALRALALCQGGRVDDARPIFDALAAQRFDDLTVNVAWLSTLTISAHVAAVLGDRTAGEALAAKLRPFREQIIAPVGFPWGCVAHHAAIAAGAAAGLDDVATLFDEAEAIHVRLGAAFMAERTRIERGADGGLISVIS